MTDLVWSIIAIAGGLLVVAVILWFLVTGRGDRDQDEAARRFYDEHGRWPDEAP